MEWKFAKEVQDIRVCKQKSKNKSGVKVVKVGSSTDQRNGQ